MLYVVVNGRFILLSILWVILYSKNILCWKLWFLFCYFLEVLSCLLREGGSSIGCIERKKERKKERERELLWMNSYVYHELEFKEWDCKYATMERMQMIEGVCVVPCSSAVWEFVFCCLGFEINFSVVQYRKWSDYCKVMLFLEAVIVVMAYFIICFYRVD